MTIDNQLLVPLLEGGTELLFKALFVIFAMLYFVFSLIVIRQVSLMTETVITEGGPLLKALSIIHAGLSLGIIVLFVGLL